MTREEAIEQITAEKSYIEDIPGSDKTVKALEMAIEALRQPEEKKGKWKKNDNGTYSCSFCQTWIPNEQHYYANYCLYCGAKMEGEECQLKDDTSHPFADDVLMGGG